MTEARSSPPAGPQPPFALHLIGESDGTLAVAPVERLNSPDERSPIIPASIFLALGLFAVLARRRSAAAR